jgi:hypothetical protein
MMAGGSSLTVDPDVLGPEQALARIVESVLKTADDFLASQDLDPTDAAMVGKAKSDVCEHRDQLLQFLASRRSEPNAAGFAASLGVILANLLLIAGRVSVSDTSRRRIERAARRLTAAALRAERQRRREPFEQALEGIIKAVFREHPELMLKAKYREINRRLRVRGHSELHEKTIRRHRSRLGLR